MITYSERCDSTGVTAIDGKFSSAHCTCAKKLGRVCASPKQCYKICWRNGPTAVGSCPVARNESARRLRAAVTDRRHRSASG